MKKLLKYLLYYVILSYVGNAICLGLIKWSDVMPALDVMQTFLLSPVTFPQVFSLTFVLVTTWVWLMLGHS